MWRLLMAGKPTFSLGSRSGRLIVAGSVLGAVLALYGALEAYAGSGIPRNTMVGEIAVGGLSQTEAASALTSAFVHSSGDPFQVQVADKTFALPAVERAVRVDISATLDAISHDRWNPIALLAMMRGEPILAVLNVDKSALANALTSIRQATEVPAVNAGIDLSTDLPTVIPAQAGLAIDIAGASQSIVDAALLGRSNVTLQRVEQPAVISTLVAQKSLTDVALPAISDSITVNVAMEDGTQRSSVIQASTIRSALTFVVSGALLEPKLDGLVLRKDLNAAIFDVQKFAKRAKFRVDGESITIVPSIQGYGISASSIAVDVAKVIRNGGATRTVSLHMGPITPSFTTEDAQALGITELVSSYTQRFPAAAYRTTNIGTAARYINGTMLMPGDTFSMNDTVKERTVENGYTSGWIIGPGGVFKNEMGGAVSTITTAMYNAAWFAGMKLVEHRAHSIYISRYEPGREATVSWGSFDMKFKNNLDHAVLITTKLRGTSISVYFWGTKQWEDIGSVFGPWTNQSPYSEIISTDTECHDQDGMPGFHITVWRTFFKNGVEVKREPYTTSYRPSPHVICAANAAPKPKPTPTPTPTVPPTDTSTV